MAAILQTTFSNAFSLMKIYISIKISLKFVPNVPINNIPTSVQVMAWRWPGDKPLSELMVVSLLTHIRVTRPQWLNSCDAISILRNMLHVPLWYYLIIEESVWWLLMPWRLFGATTSATIMMSLVGRIPQPNVRYPSKVLCRNWQLYRYSLWHVSVWEVLNLPGNIEYPFCTRNSMLGHSQ